MGDLKQFYQQLRLDDPDLLTPLGEILNSLGYSLGEAEFKDLGKNLISFHKVSVKDESIVALVRVSEQVASSETDFAMVKGILGPMFYFAGWRHISVFLGVPFLTTELKMWQKALESGAFEKAAIITADDIAYFKQKSQERIEVVRAWFPTLSESPPAKPLKETERNYLFELFRDTAANYPSGSEEFFRFLTNALSLPRALRAAFIGTWKTPNHAADLMAWAQSRDSFPGKPGYTMLGAVLKCFYENINPDEEIKRILKANRLIPERDAASLQMAANN